MALSTIARLLLAALVLLVIIVAVATRCPAVLLAVPLAAAGWALTRGPDPHGVHGGAAGARAPFDLEDFAQTPHSKEFSPRGDQILQEICYFRNLARGRDVRRVVDITAHVGVDTATLAHSFPEAEVVAVERDPATHRLLKKNMKKLGYAGRVTTVEGSGADYLAGAPKADLVYMDPPWGGPGYEASDDLPLHDKKGKPEASLAPVVDQALKVAPVVVLKTPHNFNYRSFEQKIDAHVVSVARVKYRRRNYRGKRALFNLLEIRKTACREA